LADLDLAFVITTSIAIIAVILSYIDMRRRLRQEQEASKAMANLINTLREELELFRNQSKTSEDLERQKLLARKERQQWNRMKDVFKAIGWFVEHAEDEENEEY
jgi:hypothetical protein